MAYREGTPPLKQAFFAPALGWVGAAAAHFVGLESALGGLGRGSLKS